MPKIIDYGKKRLEIATDAMAVFAKKGYYKTNLKDIAQAAGMGRSSLYKYFKNKDEIYYYIIKRAYDSFEDQVDALMAMEMSNMDRLEALAAYLAETLKNTTISNRFVEFWMVIHSKDKELEDQIFKLSDQITDRFEMLIKGAKDTGEILAEINEKALASIMLAAIESLTFLREEDLSDEAYLSTMHPLVNGIKERG
jgi:AcrR family transcriptional regulator